MIYLDTWIYALPAEWDAIADYEVSLPIEPAPPVIPRQVYDNAITGFWKAYTGGYEVYNVIGD